MMNPPIRPRQVSPLSMESTDSSFLSRYQTMSPAEPPYGGMIVPGSRTSPPSSQHASHSTNASRSGSNRTPSGSNGHHSSASSVARSSEGNGLHSPVMSEGGRSHSSRHEEALIEHYNVLKNYLAAHLDRDSGARPTRARDKLLRLSPTQFLELSTDVYDELLRREDFRQRGGDVVPRSLPPKTSFHPKRNQARQKLSTLPSERFKQLATDVYYELERRVPRLGGGGMERTASPAFSTASSQRRPSRGGPSPGLRGPAGYRGPSSGNSQFPTRGASISSNNDYGRPLPKTFQSNTLVPNKSTMVEDDETDEEDDPMGIENVVTGLTKRSTHKSDGSDQENIKAYEAQIVDLQEKLASLEDKLQSKDTEIEQLESSRREREIDFGSERNEWDSSRTTLESRLAELEGSAESHKATIQQHLDQNSELQDTVDSLNQENTSLRLQGGPVDRDIEGGDWQQRCQMLEEQLAEQQKVTDEVRQNATQFLQEMRILSEQSETALEKEDQLQAQIASLQAEVEEWKGRYAKTKTQLRTLNASSIGLSLQTMGGDALSSRQEFLSPNGLVNDVDVTSFQMSIDELLLSTRQNPAETLDKMKTVVIHVQSITGGDADSEYTGLLSPAGSPHTMSPQLNGAPATVPALKARVSRNANGLITATRNYISSNGLSPVSLVDAAAANLTAAVVDYLKTVGIKATSSEQLQEGMDVDDGYEMLAPKTHDPLNPLKGIEPPKFNGGWFNRLKGSFDSAYSNENGVVPSNDDDDDYNSYR